MMPWTETGTIAIALGTAALLYAIAWYLVRGLRPLWRSAWRAALLILFFVPALLVSLGWPTQQATKAPPRERQMTEAPPTAGVPPPPPVVGSPAPGASTGAPALPHATTPPPPVTRSEAPTSAPPAAEPPRASAEAMRAPPPAPRAITAAPAADPRWDVMPVFYGTDRGQGMRGARIIYDANRAGRLALGRAEVTIPKSHQVPNIERPFSIRVPFTNITLYEQTEDPARHFTIREIKTLAEADWIALVKERLAASRTFESHALVFIHGYNTDFDYALYRTAQIAYDLQFDGAPFMYSWPSASGVTGYIYDRDSAEQAEPHLRRFLELVVRETGAKNVSLIAHSMGNLPLLRVLRELGPRLPEGVKLDQIVLAAPDVDRTLFAQLAADLPRIGRGITLYASNNDRALSAARLVTGGTPRAGDIPPEGPVIMAGIDTIDVSSTSLDFLALNHSLYAERTSLIEDIKRLLQAGLRPPETRYPILVRVPTPRGDYWRFP
jgi:esterase/lipase superfamily enzyme